MKFHEAMQCLEKGERVRRAHWDEDWYLYNDRGEIKKSISNSNFTAFGAVLTYDDWELYTPQLKELWNDLYSAVCSREKAHQMRKKADRFMNALAIEHGIDFYD